MTLLETYTATIEFDAYSDIREALFNPDLSRSFDKRGFDEGNVREGVVSISHGPVQRARRRIENTQFRPERLREYERVLFPQVLNRLLNTLLDQESVDLFPVGELLSVVLAARRAGIDYDPDSLDELRRLIRYVDAFSQGSAILDSKNPDAVRALVREALAGFERDFVRRSLDRRKHAVHLYRRGELPFEELPHDILTVLLINFDDPALGLNDGRLVREVATYVQGGTHTSSQTLLNALDLLFPYAEHDPSVFERIVTDTAFAQRCVHEALRLRPTTPRMKRRAEAETVVAGRSIPKDAQVILDVARANQDASLFGDDAGDFNPDRIVAIDVPRWGLSFGAGPHQCPGRLVAGGLPAMSDSAPDDEHLFGLVALMLQEIVKRGVLRDPDHAPLPDTRTERFTRWAEYRVRFASRATAA
jgi:cytochrome P450